MSEVLNESYQAAPSARRPGKERGITIIETHAGNFLLRSRIHQQYRDIGWI